MKVSNVVNRPFAVHKTHLPKAVTEHNFLSMNVYNSRIIIELMAAVHELHRCTHWHGPTGFSEEVQSSWRT